ncbi:hypothetical protein BH18ACI4_BH18ACI4_00830 [soil metagenome]
MDPNDLRNCLDRRFQLDGDGYTWRSTVGKFTVTVAPWRTNAESNCVRVAVSDGLTDLEVDAWTHSVRCTDNWRERLQELVGKAMIRAQHRPICPNCSQLGGELVPMLVRTSIKHKSQFFGCANYRKTGCPHTVSIDLAFECDVQRLESNSGAGLAHSPAGQYFGATPKPA